MTPTSFYLFLESQPLRSVFHMDNATIKESVFRQDMLQRFIISVCVNPDIPAMGETPIKATRRNAFHFSVRCQAMNHSIRFIIQPLTLFYHSITWIFSDIETEATDNSALFFLNNIKIPPSYISQNLLSRRITVNPLIRISRISHI